MQFSFCHKITEVRWSGICYGLSDNSKLLTKELATIFFKEFLYPFSRDTIGMVLQVKEKSISLIVFIFRLTQCPVSPGFNCGICLQDHAFSCSAVPSSVE